MTIRKANDTHSRSDGLEFILSTNRIDAYGDEIVQSGCNLSDFLNNPACLVQHDPDFLCGRWERVRVENGALRGHLRLAPLGTSARIDEVRRLVEADILRATSVGFVPLQSEPLPGRKGVRYLKQILREVSLVSLPANADALAVQARNLGISNSTITKVFGQSKDATLAERQARAKIKADALMAVERAKRARARARKTGGGDEDYLSLAGLTHEEQMALLRATQEMSFAVPQSDNPWADPPELFFNGKPIYPRKNKYGW